MLEDPFKYGFSGLRVEINSEYHTRWGRTLLATCLQLHYQCDHECNHDILTNWIFLVCKKQSWSGRWDANTCTISFKISESDAITTAGLSSKVQWYIMRLSASSRLNGDKFWTPFNDISHTSFSNVITSGYSKWSRATSCFTNSLICLMRSVLFKLFFKKSL